MVLAAGKIRGKYFKEVFFMKKKLALLLALVMVLVLALVGCGEDKSKDDDDKDSKTKTTTEAATTTVPPSTEELVVGEWSAVIDLTDYIVENLGDMGDMADYFDFKDLDFKLVFELKADKTYVATIDEDAFNDTVDKLVDQMTDGIAAYYDDMLEAQGMTFEDLLATEGMTIDDYKEAVKEEANAEDLLDSMYIEDDGTYTVDGDTIVLTSDMDSESTTTLEYKNGTLKITEVTGEGTDEVADLIENITFKKN